MSGIYIHIPFCKQACHYCDFHFSTSLGNKHALLQALNKEILFTKDYLNDQNIETIYFGGGTPSMLNSDELKSIIKSIGECYNLQNVKEITLEINPDDVTLEKFEQLREIGFNRLSIGIQSFNNNHLKWMNRSHNASQAIESFAILKTIGFEDISIDLIYGIPSSNHDIWLNDLSIASSLDINHISAYCLTIEEKTTFGHWKKKNKTIFASEDFEAEQFEILMNNTTQNGFEQYEISNFCKPNHYSIHNTNYWLGKEYLGIGPSAHSYNNLSRRWNISNNNIYINNINKVKSVFEEEILSQQEIINEYILTSLRTKWGTDLKRIYSNPLVNKELLIKKIQGFIEQKLLTNAHDFITLTQKGKLLADYISSELFI
ncbi:MAG: radical SAM family heme chaperone HemW [Cytophagales bacterium]|nr:MAG: radical SAM family heme chaperone HemW [Cytophagales bacterium]